MFPSSDRQILMSTPVSPSPPQSPIEKSTQVSFSAIKLPSEDIEEYWSCLECGDSSSDESWHTCPECQELQNLFQFDGEESILDSRITLAEVLESRLNARSRHRTRSLSPSKARARSRERTRFKSRSRSEERGDLIIDEETDKPDGQIYPDKLQKSPDKSQVPLKDQIPSFSEFRQSLLYDKFVTKQDEFPNEEEENDVSDGIGKIPTTSLPNIQDQNKLCVDENEPEHKELETKPDTDKFPISYFPLTQPKDTISNMESLSSGFGEAPMSLDADDYPDYPKKAEVDRTMIEKGQGAISKCVEDDTRRKIKLRKDFDQMLQSASEQNRAGRRMRSSFDKFPSRTIEHVIPGLNIPNLLEDARDRQPVLDLLQKSAEWLELRVVELNPGLAFLGSNLAEAKALQTAHQEVLTKLQGKQSPVEDLLSQADQLIATQRPKAEVYAAMAESLGLAWKDLNAHLETRKELLNLSVSFHTRTRQYSDALDEAEKIYTDNVMPSEVEGVKQLLTTLQEKKRLVLESSMHTLQEANVLLTRLRGLLQQGGSIDSRPYHIKTSIEFACSQIEHQLEALHDRRKFLDGLFITRKTHLEQCLSLCILYQELTDVVLKLKSLRDEISAHQGLGESQVSSEILLHEHLRREEIAKNLQDQCIRHVRTAEQMVVTGHYSGTESRARAYSVLEAASALHDTCSTRTALLEQAALFFKLANTSLNKLDQAEIQVAGLATGVNPRLSVVIGLVEEAVQPALTEGYAILEVTGGRGHSHNEGVTKMVEHLEKRRSYLSSLCEHTTEQALQRTELTNTFLDQYNSINSWLIRIGDAFLQGHQDAGGSLSLAKDFFHLHQTLKADISEKKQDINSLDSFLQEIEKDLPEEESQSFSEKMQSLKNHWAEINTTLDSRIILCEIYVRFHEDAEKLQNEFEKFEDVLRKAPVDQEDELIENQWKCIQKSFNDLTNIGKEFIAMAEKIEDQTLDVNRAIICIRSMLENFGKKKLVISDLHSHFKMRLSVSKELSSLWKTYRENLRKMSTEMINLEESLCPLLRGDQTDADGMAISLEYRLSNYISAIKKIQEGIEAMVTKAEGHSYNEDAGDERSDIVRNLLQLYQNLQNKVTDYQILGTMLCQWCRNVAEIHKSCDKLERQFNVSHLDAKCSEDQIRENESVRQTSNELIQFASNEASSIIAKLQNQCKPVPAKQDIDTMGKMLERRKYELENILEERQVKLEHQLKRSQYHSDLQVISDQIYDLSQQLGNMKGQYGDNLPAAIQLKTAFLQFNQTVEMLEERIKKFVSTAEKMLTNDTDSEEVRSELKDLDHKWSTFHRQVGESRKNIDLSIEYFQLVQEAEDWFREGSELLVDIAGKSSQIHSPEDAIKLHQIIDNFLHSGEDPQFQRIKSIASLAISLYGDTPPEHVENVTKQNQHMIDSFSAINNSISTLVDNLKQAEDERAKQEKDQEEMAACLKTAQEETETARRAAMEADDARKNAEEIARIMATTPQPTTEKVEATIQTDSIPILSEEILEEHRQYSMKEESSFTEESNRSSPLFVTPLIGAVVTEGVKFTFECRLTGYPLPSVKWLKDSLSIMFNPDYKTSFIDGVCSLTIEETFTEDSALFTCRATNSLGSAETSAKLTVKENLPSESYSSPEFIKHLQNTDSKEGLKLDLNCTVTGHPLPIVTWTKNGTVIDSSPDYVIMFNNGECTLRFEELFLEDAAEYCCKAFNDHGEDTTKCKISVATAITSEKPVFTVLLSNIMARAGQKFKLECQVKGSPSPTIAWFHNGKPVKETPDCKITFDGTTASLLLTEAFPKNAGVYSVVAKNTAGETQTSSNVSVKGRIPTETSDSEMTSDADAEPIKPTIQLRLKDSIIKEGDSVRLDCVIVGHPEPEVIWYHNGKPVKESEDFKLLFHGDRCSLIIQEAYVEDGGEYKVVAMNSAGEASTGCNLTVQDLPAAPVVVAPHFLLLLEDCHICENNPVHMKAKVEGSPFPNVAWFKDSVPLLPDNNLKIYQTEDGSVSIEIPNSSLDHTGQYEIVANNTAGSAKSVAFLSVEQYLPPKLSEYSDHPMFIKLLEDTEAYSGNAITFEVEVSGKPKPLVHWSINEYRLTGLEYHNGERQYYIEEPTNGVHLLKIPSLIMVQTGTVGVTAENDTGKATSTCRLTIEDQPSISSNEDEISKRTVISESHFTRISSSSTIDGQQSSQSFSTEQKANISSGTDQPVKEIYESKVQQVTQEPDQPPVISEKICIKKFGDRKTVEETNEELDSETPTPTKKSIRKPVPARFITPLQGVIAQEDEKVFLEGVIDGFPLPSIEWTHNGGELPEDATTAIDLNRISLLVPKVAQKHSGRYTCLLDNSAGSAQCTCDVVIKKTQFPPVFSRRLQPAVLGIGNRLHLEVDVSGTPPPSVQWSKDGQLIHISESLSIQFEGTRYWLTIPKALETNSGRYGVIATNCAGQAESLADVIISDLVSEGSATHRIVYTEVQDDIRKEPVIEAGHVQKLRQDFLEELKVEKNSEYIDPSEINDKITEPPKIPGKLKTEWPPPLTEEEKLNPKQIDASLELVKDKVSSTVNKFSELDFDPSETENSRRITPIYLTDNKERLKKINLEQNKFTTDLVPGPQPIYGVILSDGITLGETPITVEPKSPDFRNFEDLNSPQEIIGEFPTVGKVSGEISKFNTVGNSDEMKPKLVKIKTEKEIKESNITELKTTISSSEKTIVETKVFREYDDNLIPERHPHNETDDIIQSSKIAYEEVKKDSKKRESVKQIATRLEESIAPLLAEDVPGGIRTFPSPAIQLPSQESNNIFEDINVESYDAQFKEFPKLEPFPFEVEETRQKDRIKASPPPRPRKFVPVKFSDKYSHSDGDSSTTQRVQLKKIKFEPPIKSAPIEIIQNISPPPPSSFDNPPNLESMRPLFLKGTVVKEEIIKTPPKKETISKKTPKIVKKFLSKTTKDEIVTSTMVSPRMDTQNKQTEDTSVSRVPLMDEIKNNTSNLSSSFNEGLIDDRSPCSEKINLTYVKDPPQQYNKEIISPEVKDNDENKYFKKSIKSPTPSKLNRLSWPPVQQFDENPKISEEKWSKQHTSTTCINENKEMEPVVGSIYWSSNVSLAENIPPLHPNLSEQSYPLEEKRDSKEYMLKYASATKKFVNPMATPKLLKQSTKAKHNQYNNLNEKPESEAKIDFNLDQKLQPFPFEAPKSDQSNRKAIPPPPKPKRFIPGCFTESDYESDYEGKPPNVWRPYAGDSDTSEYRPLKVKLKQGRTRTPRNNSPPAPSEFDTPINLDNMLKTSLTVNEEQRSAHIPLLIESKQKKPKFINKTTLPIKTNKNVPRQSNTVNKSSQSSVGKIQQMFQECNISKEDRNIPSITKNLPERQYQTLPRSTKLHSQGGKRNFNENMSNIPSYEVMQSVPDFARMQNKSLLKREEECGYAADTEGTLPRRVKSQSESTFSKNETFTTSSSFKSFQSEETKFSTDGFTSQDAMQDIQQFSQPFSLPYRAPTQNSNAFVSSESKSSKVKNVWYSSR